MFTIVRDRCTETAIEGRLFLDGVVIAYTLENAKKAIPSGFYSIENSQSPKFKRELPLLYSRKVPSSRGIRVHRGNDAVKDSAGCVLVGMDIDTVQHRLKDSADAEKMVTLLCRSIQKLSIVEQY